ncbi:EAL and HDOD domain-containing protein [Vibrio sp. LaRot3]|uniref:EAL and HDOD domain-containing protein n=1 Tax=Vibrio sp. LaRot3 TaxID=2998829 RepID=UPI0022CDC3F7|nr:EAL and HDOD domain-containing protein [Vibrio sp. LaRot3]MDA0150323.1 EAL domain-containing protein [Vibrio sp. LaRot3]
MKNTYVARQPILNSRRQTLGYELLFRDGEKNAYPAHVETNRATYRLIAENFLSVGINPAIAHSRCFVNFPYQSLVRRLPFALPKEKIVVEVLETCQPTDELFQAIRDLKQQGYVIALDDFAYQPEWERFLPLVHIVKIDIMAMGLDKACDIVKQRIAQGSKRKYLAERVESEAEFVQAREAGFHFFQGYFFSKPEMIRERYISPEHIIAMELFREVCQPEVDFHRIEGIVSRDVTLSYKLLRFVNTLSDRLEVTISSFRQALVYLGQDRLKMFVSLSVASFVSTKKPKELFNLSLQRAQFCSLMSHDELFKPHQEQAFLIGLFSILDAMFDLSIEHIVEQLPLNQAIKLALLERQGPYGSLLKIEECYERADWHGMQLECDLLDLSLDDVMMKINEAQRWSQTVYSIK